MKDKRSQITLFIIIGIIILAVFTSVFFFISEISASDHEKGTVEYYLDTFFKRSAICTLKHIGQNQEQLIGLKNIESGAEDYFREYSEKEQNFSYFEKKGKNVAAGKITPKIRLKSKSLFDIEQDIKIETSDSERYLDNFFVKLDVDFNRIYSSAKNIKKSPEGYIRESTLSVKTDFYDMVDSSIVVLTDSSSKIKEVPYKFVFSR